MIRAKKSLGQNFLSDRRVARRIIDAVSPLPTDVVIEIGPGTGALTRMLTERSGHVVAVEIDDRLVEELSRDVKAENLTILNADALSLDWVQLAEAAKSKLRFSDDEGGNKRRVRIVANLPYYISTPIIQKLLPLGRRIFDMTLMLQSEVVDRITSEPGTKEYGYLSVLVQYYCMATKLFDVSRDAFKPAPRVDSAVVRLTMRERPAVDVVDESRFFAVVRACFAQRRKTILNNLKAAELPLEFTVGPEAALKAASVEPKRRAETLSLVEFAALFKALFRE